MDHEFTFCPYGIGRIDGWVLQYWKQVKKCDMGHEHAINVWRMPIVEPKKKEKPPEVPEVERKMLLKKTKKAKLKHYPGGYD